VTVTASHIIDSIINSSTGKKGEIQRLLRIEMTDTGAGISEVCMYVSIIVSK
jgi:fructose-1-phosphate kinase PfkB-like protein